MDEFGDIVQFHYSPPFEGALDIPFESVEKYYSAYAELIKVNNSNESFSLFTNIYLFVKLVNKPEYHYQMRLGPGDTVIFNNRRVLHG